MSYQLPDLLGLLNSLAGDDDDGDLHINPLYDADPSKITPSLESYLSGAQIPPAGKPSRLQKKPTEFLREYNAGLLASTLIPFPSFPRSDRLAKPVLQSAAEWLSICALATEEVLRPGRVVDSLHVAPLLPKTIARMCDFSCSSEVLKTMINELLEALVNVPNKPEYTSPRQSPSSVEEYIKWRAKISGHRQLFEQYFSSVAERDRFNRSLSLVLEINTCVMDLFAYNIHQAWHLKSDGDRSHLNLVSLMEADPEMTLQGAINCTGEMIRQRVKELKAELDATKIKASSQPKPATSSISLGSLVSLFPSFGGSTNTSQGKIPQPDSSDNDSVNVDNDTEIRKVLLNWVIGTVHWAYEAEYFYPNVEGDDQSSSGRNRKRGSEVRDYGWVFLIKENTV
ncbi:hypothetical protein AN958_01279 [Leucoagaricus sp. SymC.cos]|nr:hypothetical protein AN958_01279 [Leucoagaricus sp. SymC.cos]